MRVIDKGHHYILDTLDGETAVELKFVKRFRGTNNHAGTTNQEVLKCLIDRVETLDAESPWEGNRQIVKHLRMAIGLHESRALMRKIEKDEIKPEVVKVSSKDGHFKLDWNFD